MENISRRRALRLLGGAAGAGVVGTSVLAGSGLMSQGSAAAVRPIPRPAKRLVMPTPTSPPTTTAPTTAARILVGMSSPADEWDLRTREVGGGLAARRIFADLAVGATSQLKLVEQAHAAGQLPVISYKAGRDINGIIAGKYNAVAAQAAARLASYDKPTAVVFWHEPHGDITPAQYVAASKQILPNFKVGKLRVGPLLNGFLLDRQATTFASYAPDELFAIWDWFGIDTYESGTIGSPGTIKPADRIPKLAAFVSSRGFSHQLGIGEYNGYSAETVAAAGHAILSTPGMWFGCLWNSTGSKGYTLTGERLAAFRTTLSDPRAARVAG